MELRPFPTASRDDRSLVVAPHLHGRGSRNCHRLKVCDLASPQLQETPEIVGVASNTEPRFRSDQRLASLQEALSVVSEVEPYASRGARTVPGGVPPRGGLLPSPRPASYGLLPL